MPTYTIDPIHSVVEFAVKHMRVATVKGRFLGTQGSIHLDENEPTKSWVDVRIDANGVDTGVKERDEHLRSTDFLNVKLHPQIHFRSTRVEPVAGDETRWRVTGELTLRGITREVTLDTTFEGRIVDIAFRERIGFSAETALDRRDFGITSSVWSGSFFVEDEVKVAINVEADRSSGTPS